MLFDLCISLFDLQLHDFIWCHKHGIVWPIWPRVAVWPVTVAVASCSCGSTPDISRHLTTQSAMPRRVPSKLRLWNILKYPETSWNSWYFMECSPEQTLILCDFMIFYAILIILGTVYSQCWDMLGLFGGELQQFHSLSKEGRLLQT